MVQSQIISIIRTQNSAKERNMIPFGPSPNDSRMLFVIFTFQLPNLEVKLFTSVNSSISLGRAPTKCLGLVLCCRWFCWERFLPFCVKVHRTSHPCYPSATMQGVVGLANGV
uniref:Uncharacterized protein n=1 Tax=Opuntia streptacantha TaxID=393608 RepID=A0A7C8Z4N9_OPUST